jgi:glyoxylase-like metal-dependent hydrolase (beta-lactamase superfamily II)
MAGAPNARELGQGRWMIDLGFRLTEGLVASYVLPLEAGAAIVETGPASCRDRLVRGLAAAGYEPREVHQVYVTHIHLDHAGGLGAIASTFPNASLRVHERGIPHMVDPSRLIASARRAWGAAADPIWGPILPVPPERLLALRGGERFPVRGGSLEVLATPGHATHHLAFLDTARGSLLSGDAAGVRLPGAPWARPAIPPPELDLEQLFASLDVIERSDPRELFYSHFGPVADARADLALYRQTVARWRDVALAAALERPEVAFVAAALRRDEEERLASAHQSPAAPDRGDLISGYEMAAQGLLRYFRTHGPLPREPP